MNIRGKVKEVLVKQQEQRYLKALDNKKTTYAGWIEKRETEYVAHMKSLPVNECVSEEVSDGDFVCVVMPGGELSASALQVIASYLQEHPSVMVAYGDEDVREPETKERRNPWFKPCWSPDVWDSYYYFGSVAVLRSSLLKEKSADGLPAGTTVSGAPVKVEVCGKTVQATLVRVTDRAAFLQQMNECVLQAGGKQRGCKSIGHISYVLFHCESDEVIRSYMWDRVVADPDTTNDMYRLPTLSIIIPTKDHPDLLYQCMAGLQEALGRVPSEVIIVDNGSNAENKAAVEWLLYQITGDDPSLQAGFRYFYDPMEFNFSKMCNRGAQAAGGDVLLFVNDDVQMFIDASLEQLVRMAVRPYTGAVGCKLYYPDSVQIQHAGITNLPMGPVHKLQFMSDEEEYYFAWNRARRNVLAVTAACMAIEKNKFMEAGGFPEDLKVAFNDVALCFKLHELGYVNVCCNDMAAFHHESVSRGSDESPEKLQRLLAEREVLYRKFPALQGKDPFYPEGLGCRNLDTRIRLAYETADNALQKVAAQEVQMLTAAELSKARMDECLHLRIESCLDGAVTGYAVVLGDDNACYKTYLILQECSTGEEGKMYRIPVAAQYRPDLVENMPDQKNVGLTGIWLRLDAACGLPAGEYRIGAMAVNRINKSGLVNFSNRTITVENT